MKKNALLLVAPLIAATSVMAADVSQYSSKAYLHRPHVELPSTVNIAVSAATQPVYVTSSKPWLTPSRPAVEIAPKTMPETFLADRYNSKKAAHGLNEPTQSVFEVAPLK